MSLAEPNIIERSITAWLDFKYKRTLIVALLGLVLFALVLFGIDRCDTYRDNQRTEALRANVNAAMAELANVQTDVTKDKQDEAVAIERVRQATIAYLEARNAATGARNAVNEALVNLQEQVNANKPTGTTADDLKRKLDELGIE